MCIRDRFIDDESDSSGVSLHVTKTEPKYLANIYLFEGDFQLPAHTKGLPSNSSSKEVNRLG